MIKGLLYKLLLITLGCSVPAGAILYYHHSSETNPKAHLESVAENENLAPSLPLAFSSLSPSTDVHSSSIKMGKPTVRKDNSKGEKSFPHGEENSQRGELSSSGSSFSPPAFQAFGPSDSSTLSLPFGGPKPASSPAGIPRAGAESPISITPNSSLPSFPVASSPSPTGVPVAANGPILGGGSLGINSSPPNGNAHSGLPLAASSGGTPNRLDGPPAFANAGGEPSPGEGNPAKKSGSPDGAPGGSPGHVTTEPPGQQKKSEGSDLSSGTFAEKKIVRGDGSGLGMGGGPTGPITPLSATLPLGMGPNLGNGTPTALTVLSATLPGARAPIANISGLTPSVSGPGSTQNLIIPTPVQPVSLIQSPQVQNLQVADSSVPPMRVGFEAQVVEIPITVSVLMPNGGVTCDNLKEAQADPKFQNQLFMGSIKISLWYGSDQSGPFDTEEYWESANPQLPGHNTGVSCRTGKQGDRSTNISDRHYTWVKMAATYYDLGDEANIIYTADPQVVSCDQLTSVCFQLGSPPNKTQVVADQKASLNLQNSGGDPPPPEAVPVSSLTLDTTNSEIVIRVVESGMVEIKGQITNSLQFLNPLAN